jgi:hypothetical protein
MRLELCIRRCLNSADGCLRLAILYNRGRGTRKDKKQASRHYIKSCKLENKIGCRIMGARYKIGNGVLKSNKKSNIFYKKACKLDDVKSCNILKPERNKKRFTELLVIIGDEDEKNNFSPAKDIRQPFIEVENHLVGYSCLHGAIVKDAFRNFERKIRLKNKNIEESYYVDILVVRNKQEMAIVFKNKIKGKKDEFKDSLPIIRYDKKDTDKMFNACINIIKKELSINDKNIAKHKVSREILTLIFPKRFYNYLNK